MEARPLFQYQQTWGHFIGGYYKTIEKFIEEAQTLGITRRAPYHVIKNMQFGDRVILLRYGGKGNVTAFGEMRVESITFENGIAQEVGNRLIENGQAVYKPGGSIILRECGSFSIAGTFEITVDLSNVMQLAQEIADEKGVDLFCMVGGRLTRAYDNPPLLNPAPKFTRSFVRFDLNPSFEYQGENPTEPRQMISIENYQKA